MKLPDFPWDLLAPYATKAKSHPGGGIDLSQGTPVDPTPEFIQSALGSSTNSPGYPLTIGSSELRAQIREWAISELGATGDFDFLPTIGSKELIAWLPTLLGAKKVLYPKIAYPTYLVGALIAQAEAQAVAIDAQIWPAADLAWINSPSNPTGQVQSENELAKAIDYARKNKAIVASDECYLPFGDSGEKPISILSLTEGNNQGILSVHSLSKRSNLAGYRAGIIIGDANLIAQIREIRKHAGMILPAPIQKAMQVALADQGHVALQAKKYQARRAALRPALENLGYEITHSNAGLYIWCSNQNRDWQSVEWFSERGIIVTPGSFYGAESSNFIRIALTATDENIAEVVKRIS